MIKAIRVILALILIVLLTACGNGPQPSNSLIKQALSLHFNQIQQELVQELRLNVSRPPQFVINRVAVAEEQPLSIQNLPAFRVQGTYDVTLELPERKVVQRNPFELYLQRQLDQKTWRWARQTYNPDQGLIWVTQPVQ